jgi:putative Holliday junction resolvase
MILGLDVGDRLIGVAKSDAILLTAQGLTTIERVGIRKDTGKIVDLVKEYGCDAIVIGLPLRLNGGDSQQTEKVREFADMLGNKLRSNGMQNVTIIFEDERFTTSMAEAVLIVADVSRKKRKTVIDKQAAIIILQSYLDSLDR